MRNEVDGPEFPDGVAIIGTDDGADKFIMIDLTSAKRRVIPMSRSVICPAGRSKVGGMRQVKGPVLRYAGSGLCRSRSQPGKDLRSASC